MGMRGGPSAGAPEPAPRAPISRRSPPPALSVLPGVSAPRGAGAASLALGLCWGPLPRPRPLPTQDPGASCQLKCTLRWGLGSRSSCGCRAGISGCPVGCPQGPLGILLAPSPARGLLGCGEVGGSQEGPSQGEPGGKGTVTPTTCQKWGTGGGLNCKYSRSLSGRAEGPQGMDHSLTPIPPKSPPSTPILVSSLLGPASHRRPFQALGWA